jgi:hypothetical protein
VRSRLIVNEDGTTERWRLPRLAPWEIHAVIAPSRDPTRRTWLHRDEPHSGDGEGVSALRERPQSWADADIAA